MAGGTRERRPLWAGQCRCTPDGSSVAVRRSQRHGAAGHRDDYDGWAAAGCSGWSFDDVLPAFRRLEHDQDFDDNAHGTRGPVPIRRYPELTNPQQAFLEACEATGHTPVPDHNAPGVVGAGRLPVNELDGLRESTALTYLAQARDRPNLTIRGGAPSTESCSTTATPPG